MPTTLAKIRAAGFDISAQTAAYADIRRILSYEIK
jgi:hypothetical protein